MHTPHQQHDGRGADHPPARAGQRRRHGSSGQDRRGQQGAPDADQQGQARAPRSGQHHHRPAREGRRHAGQRPLPCEDPAGGPGAEQRHRHAEHLRMVQDSLEAAVVPQVTGRREQEGQTGQQQRAQAQKQVRDDGGARRRRQLRPRGGHSRHRHRPDRGLQHRHVDHLAEQDGMHDQKRPEQRRADHRGAGRFETAGQDGAYPDRRARRRDHHVARGRVRQLGDDLPVEQVEQPAQGESLDHLCAAQQGVAAQHGVPRRPGRRHPQQHGRADDHRADNPPPPRSHRYRPPFADVKSAPSGDSFDTPARPAPRRPTPARPRRSTRRGRWPPPRPPSRSGRRSGPQCTPASPPVRRPQ